MVPLRVPVRVTTIIGLDGSFEGSFKSYYGGSI